VNILILGVNHQIQRPFGSSDPKAVAFVRQQKEQFVQLLRDEIRQRRIQFVGEEANHLEESIAKAVCAEEGCVYANIEMEPDERKSRGIPRDYNESKTLPQAEKDRLNREREDFMRDSVHYGASGASTVLVICGHNHSESLANDFRSQGHAVEIDDLRNRNWYIEDWRTHMFDNL
jgi:hypothetical protein